MRLQLFAVVAMVSKDFKDCTDSNDSYRVSQKNAPVAFLSISPIKLHLLGFSRTVLKSAGSHDSKTVPESSN